MELSPRAYVEVLARIPKPSSERVMLVCPGRKMLQIPKAVWQQLFGDWGGMALQPGEAIEIRPAEKGGNKISLPGWAIEQLALSKGERLCITTRWNAPSAEDRRYFLKKLRMDEMASQIPGAVVIDTFGDREVIRRYSLETDSAQLTTDGMAALLSEMGGLCHDPIQPRRSASGWIGLIARRDLDGGLSQDDAETLVRYRGMTVEGQGADGSWDGNVVRTAFNVIRLLELGWTASAGPVERATRWLLETPEPVGLPGLFMYSEELARRFNAWKEKPGAKGRPHRRSVKGELWSFLENRDLLPNLSNSYCALRLTWPTAVALEALLRCQLHAEPRVVRAINTLLALRGPGGWCGCGYLDARVEVPPSDDPIDLDAVDVPSENVPHLIDWYADEKEVAKWVAGPQGHTVRLAQEIGPKEALLVRRFHSTGDCSLVMHRALSYHPQYAGSRLEAVAALECAFRQGVNGTWGDAYLGAMFETLGRLKHPLAAFLVLRSIPLLIREQDAVGLWHEAPPRKGWSEMPAPCKAQSTLSIVRGLQAFGFLDTLLPQKGA